MAETLTPAVEELRSWLLVTLRHSCDVEYYLSRLHIGHYDFQRPHDLSGPGNKLCWEVASIMALESRNSSMEYFKENLLPAVELHRKGQYHHRPISGIPILRRRDHKKVNLIDTLCCLMEDRPYFGGERDYDGLSKFVGQMRDQRKSGLERILLQMRSFPRPALKDIESPISFPNIGLPERTYRETLRLASDAVTSLERIHGYYVIE
ncbi:MAG: hypothetical protein CMN78_00170 [Spirochaetales bacterium]|nr:hypothetical protein [Spirochaetales bacterium]